MKRITGFLPFFVLFLLPLLFYHGVDTSGWRSSSDVHALLEFGSSLLAITAGVMVLSIPAEILSKPTKLSEIEFSLIKEHAKRGYDILRQMNGTIDMQVDDGTTWVITFPVKNEKEWRNEKEEYHGR